MKILVTGGGGFLGRYVCLQAMARGWTVVALGRSPRPDLEAMGIRYVRADVTDIEALTAASRGCQAVIHTAAKAGVWGSKANYERANITGAEAVLAACKRNQVQCLVHTSTPSVVFSGQSFEGADESLPYGKNWLCHYAETKARAEQLALAAHNADGLRVCALRPHLIFGKGDPHLLPRVLQRAKQGRLRIVGDGTNRVDITHVANAADAHLLAVDALLAGRAGGKAYFLSQGEPVVLWPWINDFLKMAGVPIVSRTVSASTAYGIGAVCEGIWSALRLAGEPPMTRFVAVELAKSHWFSIEAAKKDLGYAPKVSTKEGLEEYVRSLKLGGHQR